MTKDTTYFYIQGARSYLWYLPPIPINCCGAYTLEKDSLEHVKKYMML